MDLNRILSTILTFFLILSCSEKEVTSKNLPPHPDSIGVRTNDYKAGTLRAINDFSNDTSNFYLVGLIRMDSLEIKMMKEEFRAKYKLFINLEGCESGTGFIKGYNNKIKELIEKKYKINLRDEIVKWTI